MHYFYRLFFSYDWRTKKPVILRASLQWFIDTDSIKDQALVIFLNLWIQLLYCHTFYDALYIFFFRKRWKMFKLFHQIWKSPCWPNWPVVLTGAFQDSALGAFPSQCFTKQIQIHLAKLSFISIRFKKLIWYSYSANTLIIYCREIVERVCQRTLENGIDEWWISSPEELIGDDLMKRLQLTPGHIQKGQVFFLISITIISYNLNWLWI